MLMIERLSIVSCAKYLQLIAEYVMVPAENKKILSVTKHCMVAQM
jgi:hypothetical protein